MKNIIKIRKIVQNDDACSIMNLNLSCEISIAVYLARGRDSVYLWYSYVKLFLLIDEQKIKRWTVRKIVKGVHI